MGYHILRSGRIKDCTLINELWEREAGFINKKGISIFLTFEGDIESEYVEVSTGFDITGFEALQSKG